MNRVAFAGNMIVDYVKEIDNYPARGQLSSIRRVSHCVGGCACNTSIGFARLDREMAVTAFGRVGEDENGLFIRKTLEQEGIRCKVTIDAHRHTSFTDVMSIPGGERTFFHARGANAAFCMSDIPVDELDCELFHIGYILLLDAMDMPDGVYGTQMAKLLAKIRAQGIKTSVDVVSEHSNRYKQLVMPALKHCDYLIINEIEASQITGISIRDEGGRCLETAIQSALQMLLDWGVHELAAIHAPEGGWAMTKNGKYAHAPSLSLPLDLIKGTVGAGDAFCAGMLYGLCKGFELHGCLAFAAGVAACNLSSPDSIGGMRDYDATVQFMKLFPESR